MSESGTTENKLLVSRSAGIGGASCLLVGLQFPSSSRSRSRMCEVLGRADGESEDSNSSNHVWVNNVHNASENPSAGLSGRTPYRTFSATAVSSVVLSKGFRPVITYGGKLRFYGGSGRGSGVTYFKDCHSEGIYVGALGRQLSPGTFNVPILIWE